MKSKKVILAILDGWGIGENKKGDAIFQAKTPFFDHLFHDEPHNTLTTFGVKVGLPKGQMGNSEVGHMNIGAGRIVYQEFLRINNAIKDGSFQKNPELLKGIENAKKTNQAFHIFGLLSDGGVHSHIKHLKAICDVVDQHALKNVFIHAILDGRDTDPHGGINYIKDLSNYIQGKNIKIASVIGRYYSMDRDKRWARIKLGYDLMVKGIGEPTENIIETLQARYNEGQTDEFIKPIVIVKQNKPIATIQNGDTVFCFNYRTDRPRQITEVLTQTDMPDFGMKKMQLYYMTMTNYKTSFHGLHILFDKANLKATLGEVLSQAGKTQLRIAETEKYAHVTFFFNGGIENPFKGESRIIVPSPKVATYDLQPEMSANEVADKAIQFIKKEQPDFICLNFANTDMVGHTGDFKAAMKAAETVDNCLKRLLATCQKYDYTAIIIADHGNSDYMINPDGSPNTAHSVSPVPIIIYGNDEIKDVKQGKLGDLAPTILSIMGIEIPKEMDGEILINRNH